MAVKSLIVCILCILSVQLCFVKCRTTYVELTTPTVDEISFMRKYGYLADNFPDSDATYTPVSIAEAVKKMQAFAGLPRTGLLDPKTRKLFTKKRCGVKDIDTSKRNKRYVLVQPWTTRSLTFRVMNGSSTFDKASIEARMTEALALWAPHGNLHFTKIDEGHADIRVSFFAEEHGDGFPFDGPGLIVAHAYPPPHGAMHFDDEETWGDNPDGEDDDITDFFAVAMHEIGHALGLSHSNVKESVMYPYYQVPVERLGMDDILAMQELYLKDKFEEAASRGTEFPTRTSIEADDPILSRTSLGPEDPILSRTSLGPDDPILSRTSLGPHFTLADDYDEDGEIPNLCYTNYDTIQVIHGKIYVFEEEWVWVMSRRKEIDPGYPRPFHHVFVGLPSHVIVIKAIYEKLNGNVVIFSGRQYWEFNKEFRLIKSGKISDYHLPRYVAELTSVFVSNYNNKTYLIDDERFWRFDEETWSMDRGYPKDMGAWRAIPAPVDAALVWEGDTFFFRGPRFWRFDNTYIRAHQYYPLPTAPIWFPCKESSEMERYTYNEDR